MVVKKETWQVWDSHIIAKLKMSPCATLRRCMIADNEREGAICERRARKTENRHSRGVHTRLISKGEVVDAQTADRAMYWRHTWVYSCVLLDRGNLSLSKLGGLMCSTQPFESVRQHLGREIGESAHASGRKSLVFATVRFARVLCAGSPHSLNRHIVETDAASLVWGWTGLGGVDAPGRAAPDSGGRDAQRTGPRDSQEGHPYPAASRCALDHHPDGQPRGAVGGCAQGERFEAGVANVPAACDRVSHRLPAEQAPSIF